jgi:8-hydroxy-5-deazaflavin:NADPH oxidoreductase
VSGKPPSTRSNEYRHDEAAATRAALAAELAEVTGASQNVTGAAPGKVDSSKPAGPVAIVGGTGQLGFGLALRLARAGVPVVIGSRQETRASEAAARARDLVPDGDVRGYANERATSAAAQVVVLAVPFASQATTITSIADDLRHDQIMLDATVPLGPAIGGKPTTLVGVWQGSAAQQAQALVPDGVRVVSGLHTLSGDLLADLDHALEQDTLICGDRKVDKQVVIDLLSRIDGLRCVDAGRLEQSRITEGLTAMLIGINMRHKTHAGIQITGYQTEIAQNSVIPFDSPPRTVSSVLERLDPLRGLADALEALGLTGAVSFDRLDDSQNAITGFVLSWPLPEQGHVRVICEAIVQASSGGRSMVSVRIRADTDDPAGRSRLIAAWPLIGPVVEAQKARLTRALAELVDIAEDGGEPELTSSR